VRQAVALLKLARRLVLVEPGQPMPEDLRGPMLDPPVRGRLVVLPTEEGRCRRCGAPLMQGDGLPDAPGDRCSTCRAPSAECTCMVIDEERDGLLLDELDAAAVLVDTLGNLVRRAVARLTGLPEGDPVRLVVEALPERVERLVLHVARAVGMFGQRLEKVRAAEVDEAVPPSLTGALLEVELSAAELHRSANAAAGMLPAQSEAYDVAGVRQVLAAQGVRASLEAHAAAVLRLVIAAEPGSPRAAEVGEDLARLIQATQQGNAPAGFSGDIPAPSSATAVPEAHERHPSEDPEVVRLQVEGEGGTLEGWSPAEGVWWALWKGGQGFAVEAWINAPTAAELLAQLRWLTMQIATARAARGEA
jgi:hypothetical protein